MIWMVYKLHDSEMSSLILSPKKLLSAWKYLQYSREQNNA